MSPFAFISNLRNNVLTRVVLFFGTYATVAGALWGSTEAFTHFTENRLKENLGTYWWVVFYAVPLLIATIVSFRKSKDLTKSEDESADISKLTWTKRRELEFENDTRRFFNSLKERYRSRYEQKLDGRFEITLEVSHSADSAEAHEIKERFGRNPSAGDAIKLISKAFDKTGRLLIVGSPGIGKTVLLLKLASNTLSKIAEKLQQGIKLNKPFPVIFNLGSWSESYEKFDDWLIAMLVSGEGLSRDFAARLLRKEKIIFLLDGLDELARNRDPEGAAEIRAACLRSLNRYLQRGRKVVICCRENEFRQLREATRQDAPVSARVTVFDLDEAQITAALREAQQSDRNRAAATNLLTILNEDRSKVFLEVLHTPFYFTTALEVFDQQILDEKVYPKNADELRKHLLDGFVKRKRENTSNPNDFDPETTRRWLTWLARLMEKHELITFELADLQPMELSKRWHYNLGIGSIFGLVVGLGFGLVPVFMAGLVNGVVEGLITGLVVGASVGLIRGFEVSLREGLAVGIRFGLVVGLVGGLVFGLVLGLNVGLGAALIGALVFGVGGAVAGSLVGNKISTQDIVSLDFTKLLSLGFLVRTLFASAAVGTVIGFIISTYSGSSSGMLGGLLGALLVALGSGLEQLKHIDSYAGLENAYQRIRGGFFVNLFTYGFLIAVIILLMFIINSLGLGEEVTKVPKMFLIGLLVIYAHLLFFTPLLKHSILRLCLCIEGSMPTRYATFLDYVSAARILEKDGGHWRFRHQNLQEYFAGKIE